MAFRLGDVYSVSMPTDANSVNMEKRYHHGDLRAALIAAGLDLLAQRDGAAPGLRELARAAGVSATAVYRHFPDHNALLAALAAAGLDKLAEAQRAAAEAAGGGKAAFAATGRAYVRFALDNPSLFRLIFTSRHAAGDMGQGSAFAMLRANAEATAPPGEGAAYALGAWSIVHGLATLLLDGQVDADDAMIARVIEGAVPR